MTIKTLLIWWQFVAIVGINLLGLVRAMMMRSQGLRAVVVDHKQPVSYRLRDWATVLVLLMWFLESTLDAFSVSSRLLPSALYVILVDQVWLQVIGAVMMGVGLFLYVLAIQSFGISWRIGIDKQAPGPLVTRGVFAWTRNPIYVALDLCAVGTFFICGRLVFLALAVGVIILLHDQILREEAFLANTSGEAYRDYSKRIGRYVTWPFRH